MKFTAAGPPCLRFEFPVQGWRIHASKLSQVDWPEGLLKKQKLGVVTVQRKADEPWSDSLILVVVLLGHLA